jgi:hypothetical protein
MLISIQICMYSLYLPQYLLLTVILVVHIFLVSTAKKYKLAFLGPFQQGREHSGCKNSQEIQRTLYLLKKKMTSPICMHRILPNQHHQSGTAEGMLLPLKQISEIIN